MSVRRAGKKRKTRGGEIFRRHCNTALDTLFLAMGTDEKEPVEDPDANTLQVAAGTKPTYRRVIEAASLNWDRLAAGRQILGGEDNRPKQLLERQNRECLQRMRNGSNPQKLRLERALHQLWNPVLTSDDAPLHECHKATIGAYQELTHEFSNREEFVTWFSERFEEERKARREAKRQAREAAYRAEVCKYVALGRAAEGDKKSMEKAQAKPLAASDATIAAVNRFLAEVSLEVTNGTLVLDPKTSVNLGPLYEYIERLQATAWIPSYFPGLPDIPLDMVYVEMNAVRDFREAAAAKYTSREWSAADRSRNARNLSLREATLNKSVGPDVLVSCSCQTPSVLFGDPGSGKSTFSLSLLHSLGKQFIRNDHHLSEQLILPFRVVLRELTKYESVPTDCTLAHIVRSQLNVSEGESDIWLRVLHRIAGHNGAIRLMIILDGIDELPHRSVEFSALRTDWNGLAKAYALLFTSRRSGFKPPVFKYTTFELLGLPESAVNSMIENWFGSVAPRSKNFSQSFKNWIIGDARRQEMARNPSLLTMLCYLNKDRGEADFLQELSRTRLYELAVDTLAEEVSEFDGDVTDLAFGILGRFALSLYTDPRGNGVPFVLFRKQRALETLSRLIHPRDRHSRNPSKLFREWIKARFLAQWDLGSWHCFAHLTFQEYFAAVGLFGMPRPKVRSLLSQHAFNPHWREVWHFYVGLCREEGPNGGLRFEDVAAVFCAQEDLFKEVLYLFAPLCGEYGIRDTSLLLKFDLRLRLLELIRSEYAEYIGVDICPGISHSILYLNANSSDVAFSAPVLLSRAKSLIELDPAFCFGWVRKTIDQLILEKGGAVNISDSDRIDLMLAIGLLNLIHHGEALDYQKRLMIFEATSRSLHPSIPPLGPCFRSGRNGAFCDVLCGVDFFALSGLRQERVIRYLALSNSPNAADMIAEIAIKSQSYEDDRLEIQTWCLDGLCELRDPRAVELANVLWGDSEFRRSLSILTIDKFLLLGPKHCSRLLEGWLFSPHIIGRRELILTLFEVIRDCHGVPLSEGIFQVAENDFGDREYSEALWGVALTRGGQAGVDLLLKRVSETCAKEKIGRFEWQWLAVMAGIMASHKIIRTDIIKSLVARIPADMKSESLLLWAALVAMHVRGGSAPDADRWLRDVAVPFFGGMLKAKVCYDRDVCDAWVDCWKGSSESVLCGLRDVILVVSTRSFPRQWAGLFGNFLQFPKIIPVSIARRMFESKSENYRHFGRLLLLFLDPRLLCMNLKNLEVKETLSRLSYSGEVIFFSERAFCADPPGYINYLGD